MSKREFEIFIGWAISAGCEVSGRAADGTPFLFEAIFASDKFEDRAQACAMIDALIDRGADPHALNLDGSSILIGPILGVRPEIVALLLTRGVDPNRGSGDPGETVYDAAVFDYHYEAWYRFDDAQPLAPSEDDLASEDRYLSFLDRLATANAKPRPDILFDLRRHGARSGREIAASLGGPPKSRIQWSDGAWSLSF